jgi:hypothetical protein
VLYGFNGTSPVPIRIDPSTRVFNSIELEHGYVHDGIDFSSTDTATVDSGSTRVYKITTPDTTKWAHLVWEIDGTAITQIDVYEGGARNNGTGLTIYNRDRNSVTANTTTVVHTPDAGANGTIIYTEKFGLATGNNARQAGYSRPSAEVVLKRNTQYIIVVSSSTNGNIISSRFRWYELIDKN